MVLVAVAFAGGLAGCGGGARYDVRVALDEAWVASGRVPTLEVDVVGANPTEAALLNQKDLRAYFSANDEIRTTFPKRTVVFTQADTVPKTVPKSDAVWKTWNQKGADQMFVLVNLPGVSGSLPGDADPRRLVLPLSSDVWLGSQIDVEVRQSGLVVTTEQQAPTSP